MKIDIYYNKDKNTTEFKTEETISFDYFGEKIVIPKGFISDGMSIPKFLWVIISPKINGETLLQSIKHDYLFFLKMGFWKSNWYYFKDLKNGLNLIQRLIVLIGLTLFGWTHY